MWGSAIFGRIASLPLSVGRANRLLRMALKSHELRHHAETLAPIAALADPLPADQLPPVDDMVLCPTENAVDLYRKLGGALAEERIRAWVCAPDVTVYGAVRRARRRCRTSSPTRSARGSPRGHVRRPLGE